MHPLHSLRAPLGRDVGTDFTEGQQEASDHTVDSDGQSQSGQQRPVRHGQGEQAFTGIKSRLFGFPVLGAAPHTIRAVRGIVCRPLGIRKPGVCLMTGLALAQISCKDPSVTMAIDNVVEFACAHRASSKS